ncbi:hypothetical protein LguiA_017804 [Lonicera macranthoides]
MEASIARRGEIFVVPFFGQGHLFPSMELCKHLSSRNYQTTLIIPSHLSSSVPSDLRHHPSIQITEISIATPPPPPPPEISSDQSGPGPEPGSGHGRGPNAIHNQNQELGEGIESFLLARSGSQGPTRPVCAVVDSMMSWSKVIFAKFDVPAVSFLTTGACSTAMEYAAWKVHVDEMKPGETRILPGLPEDMALSYSDLERRPRRGGPGPRGFKFGKPGPGLPEPGQVRLGPPGPGQKPRWLDEVEGSIALLINTCSDMEHTFIDYVSTQIEKPVWGVGPLLPEQYWKSVGSVLHDNEIRSNGHQSNYTENEVIEWLDSKSRGSVIYISFGSEVGPTEEEYGRLASALEKSNQPFIWVIQPGSGKSGPPRSFLGGSDSKEEGGYYPHGLEEKAGERALIIRGWAPQLLILSHHSTGGFLSHCGWNSTIEALGRGVPILAWPIRGDQYHNAKLVVAHLKMGYMVSTSDINTVKEEDIAQGIEKLMGDEEVRRRVTNLRGKFERGFPASSVKALDAFGDFIRPKSI